MKTIKNNYKNYNLNKKYKLNIFKIYLILKIHKTMNKNINFNLQQELEHMGLFLKCNVLKVNNFLHKNKYNFNLIATQLMNKTVENLIIC